MDIPKEFISTCSEAKTWLKTQPNLQVAYDNCTNPYWIVCAANKLNLLDKLTAINLTIECAEIVVKYKTDKYQEIFHDAINAAKKCLVDRNEKNIVATYTIANEVYITAKADIVYNTCVALNIFARRAVADVIYAVLNKTYTTKYAELAVANATNAAAYVDYILSNTMNNNQLIILNIVKKYIPYDETMFTNR